MILLPLLLTLNTHAIEPAPRPDAWWLPRHHQIVDEARQIQPRVAFLGDSITELWRVQGQAVWQSDLAPLKAANLGIGGDGIGHLWWRVRDGALDGIRPDVIVLLIGTNDIFYYDVAELARGHADLVAEIRARAPQAKLLLLGVFPRADAWTNEELRAKIPPLNAELERLAAKTGATYLDVALPTELMHDGLHPTEAGYRLWADRMLPTLKRLLE